MTAKTLKIRLISREDPDLPQNIEVVEADTYEQAARQMLEAFNKPKINAVVWTNAGNLISEVDKATVEGLIKDSTAQIPLKYRLKTIWPLFNGVGSRQRKFDTYLSECFKSAAAHCKSDFDPHPFVTLAESWRSFYHALDQQKEIKALQSAIRLRNVSVRGKGHDLHVDVFWKNRTRFLRTPGGLTTEFAAETDIIKPDCFYNINCGLKKDATDLWAPPLWAISMIGDSRPEKLAAHQVPGRLQDGDPSRRMLEILDVTFA